jgi:NodT family efflux transporter outer membrane factor (OMF) lipoprotein
MRGAALLLAGALWLCGCVGPRYQPQPIPPAASGGFVSPAPGVLAQAPPDGWWRLYQDPLLDELVATALAANTDLKVAVANLRQARASLSESRSARIPSTTVNGSAVRTQQVILLPTGPAAFETDFYRLSLDASYEIDLFGRVTRQLEGARANAAAAAADRDAAAIAVAAEVARAYADACTGAMRLAVAQRSLKLQEDSFAIAERRAAVGRDSPLDTARARAQLESVRAGLPDIAAARSEALFRLAVLTGKPPAAVDARAAACVAAPQLKSGLPVGDGAGLLKRRPDVRSADARLRAAYAQVGAAMADWFPRISLGGQLSGQGVNPQDVVNGNGFGYSIGPLISWSFPNIWANAARVRGARAGLDAARARFDGVVLAALKETETALADYAAVRQRRTSLAAAREASADAARIVELRYTAGRLGFAELLEAQATLAAADASLAAADAAQSNAEVALFKALGGGWQGLAQAAEQAPQAPPVNPAAAR